MPSKVLFVDDRWREESWKESFDQWLPESVEAIYEEFGFKAVERLRENRNIKLVFLDLQFDGQSQQGEEVLGRIKEQYPDLKVIILTSINDAQLALKLVHDEKKAYYYFFKDAIDPDQVRKLIENAIETYDLRAESLRNTNIGMIVGESPALQRILQLIHRVSLVDSNVLITGESGTGKELLARSIHANSKRNNGPFVAVNCAAIAENLIESELFGHVKGAFTDAIRDKPGRFEKANGGTIFLDEVGDLKIHHQARLLRVMQFGEFERVGSDTTIKVNTRIIAATNRDLEEQIRKGMFREDLYYRLNVFRVHIPPLRERKEDIPILASYILQRLNNKFGLWNEISDEAVDLLMQHNWPGNVRELENSIEQAMVASNSNTLGKEDFAALLRPTRAASIDKPMIDEWVSKILCGAAKWDDVRREFAARGDTRKQIIEGVIKSFRMESGRRPSGDELARLLVTQRNNLNQILNNLGISLKEYD